MTALPSLVNLRVLGWLLTALLPLAARGASVPQQEYEAVLHSGPDIVHGEALFSTCAACHGTNGAGVADGSVPAIAGQHFRVIVRQLVDFRHDKRWDLRMEHFSDQHHLSGAQDIADVADYISGMPSTRASDHGSGEYLQHGGEVYVRLCASCHGVAAEGDERNPRLAGQHYEYLLRQMHDALEGRRPNFPHGHVRLLQRFELADLAGVADYLSRLGD
jgi:cytochrome c553